MNGATLISVLLTEQLACGDSICLTVSARTLQLMTNRKSHMGFPLTPKIDDLGWPWTAVRSIFIGISRHFSCFGGNNT